jgi:hypothetical protein
MIRIEFPFNQNSTVFVYDGTTLILKMERKFLLGSKKLGWIFQEDKLLLAVSNFFFSSKITENNCDWPIDITLNSMILSKFQIDSNEIKIVDNPFYFLYKPFFSRIYYNKKLIAKVRLVKLLDTNGIRLEADFHEKDKTKQLHCLLCYLINSIYLNI